jgi:GNAT superfamily N-acetyltransferase
LSELLQLVDFVAMAETDINFVRQSWLKSNRSRCGWAPKAEYFALHHDVVEGLLARADTTLAVNKNDPSQILGWVCAEKTNGTPIVHYVYVKSAFRKNRLGSVLLNVAVGQGHDFIATHAPPPDLIPALSARNIKVRPTLAFYLGLKPSGVK